MIHSPWCSEIYLEIFVILYSFYKILSPLPFFKYEFTANENCPADRPIECSASPKNTQTGKWKSLQSALSLYIDTIMQRNQSPKGKGCSWSKAHGVLHLPCSAGLPLNISVESRGLQWHPRVANYAAAPRLL